MISQIESDKVVAPSSGNHAQGVAAAAKIFSKSATLVMPEDAPKSKISGVKFYDGKIVFYDRHKENRMEIAKEIAKKDNSILIPPYDHKEIILGATTSLLINSPEKCKDNHGIFDAELIVEKIIQNEKQWFDNSKSKLSKPEMIKLINLSLIHI